MRIFLMDRKDEMIDAWNEQFKDCNDVEVVKDDFIYFMKDHNVDVVVSPANSFGLMDGGYDAAITEFFGDELQKKVQERIISRWYGEQPVGTSLTVKIPNTNKLLIHVPTMRTPEMIKDARIVYQCMRVTLIEVKRLINKNLLKENCSVLIPAFGGATGFVDCEYIAELMFIAYKQVNEPPKELDWVYAEYIKNELRKAKLKDENKEWRDSWKFVEFPQRN